MDVRKVNQNLDISRDVCDGYSDLKHTAAYSAFGVDVSVGESIQYACADGNRSLCVECLCGQDGGVVYRNIFCGFVGGVCKPVYMAGVDRLSFTILMD